MVGISDAVVIGIVLGLVFAAVSYYLYSRVLQLEKKVGLMENILLDLKVTTEQTLLAEIGGMPVRSMGSLQGGLQGVQIGLSNSEVDELDELDSSRSVEHNGSESRQLPSEQEEGVSNESSHLSSNQESSESSQGSQSSQSSQGSQLPSEQVSQGSQGSQGSQEGKQQNVPSINYEANTYKELLGIARQKGVTGGSHMTKSELIAALRRRDSGEPIKEIPAAWASLLSSTSLKGNNNADIQPADPDMNGTPLEEEEDSANNQDLDDDEVDNSFVQ